MEQCDLGGLVKRWVRGGFIALAVIGIVVGLYSVSSMFWAVQGVRTDVVTVTDAVRGGDIGAAAQAVTALRDSSSELAVVTDSFPWRAAARLPVVGSSVSALRVMASGVRDMAQAAEPIADAVAQAGSTTAKVAALGDTEPELRRLALEMTALDAALADIDPSALRFGLDDQARDLWAALPGAISLVQATAEAADVLPGLFGMDGRRTWLVLLQNPAEARGSGGLFSGYALVEVADGEPTILKAETRKETLDAFDLPFRSVVSPDSVQLWGDYLGEWASFNLSGDFPEVATLASAGMAALGTPVDGVIALDAYVVQALLAGTGKVEHRGVVIDGTNAGAFFTRDLYARYPDFDSVEAKDELALGLVYATIDSLLKRPLDFPTLITTLPPVVTAGHVKAWSPNPAEQAWFTEIGVAGDIASLDPGTMLITFNNAVGGKLDAYVTPQVVVERGICVVDGRGVGDYQLSLVTVTLRNDAPLGLPTYVDVRLDDPAAPAGSTRTLVHVYGPADAVIEDVLVGGDRGALVAGYEAGRPVWGSEAEILQGQTVALTYVFAEPRGLAAEPTVILPGTAIPATVDVVNVAGTQQCPADWLTHPRISALVASGA